MSDKPKAKKPSGADYLKSKKKGQVLLGVPDADLDLIRRAAAIEMRSMANFMALYAIPPAVEAAKRILEKSPK